MTAVIDRRLFYDGCDWQVAPAVLQARVHRVWCTAAVGSLLGKTPDRLFSSVRLCCGHRRLRRGRRTTRPDGRRDASALQQSVDAHEWRGCSAQGMLLVLKWLEHMSVGALMLYIGQHQGPIVRSTTATTDAFGFCLTSLQVRLHLQNVSQRRTFGICWCKIFYWLDAVPVSKPTMSPLRYQQIQWDHSITIAGFGWLQKSVLLNDDTTIV